MPVVADNISNSSNESLARVKKITGKDVTFYQGDILDRPCLDFKSSGTPRLIVLFTSLGLKAVGESVVKSYQCTIICFNNVQGKRATLVDAMRDAGVFKLVFSSSQSIR